MHWKGWCWSWSSNTLATWCEELTFGKDPDAGKDWRQEEKGTTEDEMVGWHHWQDRHGFGWTLGVGDGQGGLMCCSSWGCKELDTTERLNWTENIFKKSTLNINSHVNYKCKWRELCHPDSNQKKSEVAMSILDRTDFKVRKEIIFFLFFFFSFPLVFMTRLFAFPGSWFHFNSLIYIWSSHTILGNNHVYQSFIENM